MLGDPEMPWNNWLDGQGLNGLPCVVIMKILLVDTGVVAVLPWARGTDLAGPDSGVGDLGSDAIV